MQGLLAAFFVIGYIVNPVKGKTTSSDFKMQSAPALVLFALVIICCLAGRLLAGGLYRITYFGSLEPLPILG